MAQLVGCLPSMCEALGWISHKLKVVAHVSGSRTQQVYAEASEAHGHSGPYVKEMHFGGESFGGDSPGSSHRVGGPD